MRSVESVVGSSKEDFLRKIREKGNRKIIELNEAHSELFDQYFSLCEKYKKRVKRFKSLLKENEEMWQKNAIARRENEERWEEYFGRSEPLFVRGKKNEHIRKANQVFLSKQ